MLNSAGEGIYGLDRSGKPTFVNPAALRLLGYGVAEIIGQPGHALIHHSYPDGRPYPIESCPIYLALRDGESHRKDDEVFWRRDGASFSVEYNSTPMRDEQGQIAGAVVVFRDITQRKHDEQSLRESLEIHRILMQNSSDAIVLFNEQGDILEANRSAEIMSGYSQERWSTLKSARLFPPNGKS